MHSEWIAMEHHRLHTVEGWPEGPHKEASLAAIQSTLQGLLRNHPSSLGFPPCEICLARKSACPVLEFPDRLEIAPKSSLAA